VLNREAIYLGEINDHVHRARKKTLEKETKTKITPPRAQYVRDHMNTPIEHLQQVTGLGEWVIYEIIWVTKADYMRGEGHGGRSKQKTKFDRMTPEMKDYLRNMDKENLKYRELKSQFNERWSDSELTPIAATTLSRYYGKLQKLDKSTKQEVSSS